MMFYQQNVCCLRFFLKKDLWVQSIRFHVKRCTDDMILEIPVRVREKMTNKVTEMKMCQEVVSMVGEIKSRESSKMKATRKMIGARFGAQVDGG